MSAYEPYINEDLGFSIEYPANWEIIDFNLVEDEQEASGIDFYPPSDSEDNYDFININCLEEDSTQDIDLEKYYADQKSFFLKSGQFEIIEEITLTIDGKPAKGIKTIFNDKLIHAEPELKGIEQIHYFLAVRYLVYVIYITFDQKNWNTLEPTIQKMLSSFHVTELIDTPLGNTRL